jgi:hypothetical protein
MTYGWVALAVAIVAMPRTSDAREPDDLEPTQVSSSVEAASSGAASPLLLNATVADGGLVISHGGYDTARGAALFDSAAEVRIWGPVSLRAGVTSSEDTRRMRPSAGARVQVLRQSAHGIDGTVSSIFRTEGFNEAEGEIETTLSLGRRFDRSYLLGNIAYGQDPDGKERDGEVRASLLRSQGVVLFGLETRGRSAIGAQHGTSSSLEPLRDVRAGAVAMVTVRSLVLFAEAGPSAFKLQGAEWRWGVASLGGICAIF